MKGIKIFFVLTLVSLAVAGLWNRIPAIRETAHMVLDPTAGYILNYNITFGLIIITAIIALGTSLVNKFTMDKELMAEIKTEQKLLQKEMEKYKDHPEKILELNKKQFALLPKTFEVTMRPALFTIIPLIFMLRWFSDYFTTNPVKIFGFLSWFLAYILLSIIFAQIFRKLFKLP